MSCLSAIEWAAGSRSIGCLPGLPPDSLCASTGDSRATGPDLGRRLPDWQDDWKPQSWKPPAEADEYDTAGDRRPRISRAAIRAAQQPRIDRKREQLLLAVSPAVAGGAFAFTLVSLSVAGRGIDAACLHRAGSRADHRISRHAGRSSRCLGEAVDLHLAAAIGLLPMLAIQVALIREPYVSIESGSASAGGACDTAGDLLHNCAGSCLCGAVLDAARPGLACIPAGCAS